MEPVDTLIFAKWILPVVPSELVLEDHAVAIQAGTIKAILTADEAEKITAAQVIRLENHILIPGLINAHGHAPMTLLRGIADDIPLQAWLEEHIWPLEGKFVSEEFVYDGALLATAEMIRSGTTCFADMYFFPEQVARAALEGQMRVQLASPVLDFPTVWAQDAEDYIGKSTALHDAYRNNELISTAFGPHAPYTVSDEPLRKISMLAEELDVPIHMHVHETGQEIVDSVNSHGKRPLKRLQDLGLLTPRLNCIHVTQVQSDEITALADNGVNVIHCPQSNLKLASGFCEIAKLAGAGVNVALGTDGCASNNDLDMLAEMQTAALLAKAVANDASAIPAHQALARATINGARALGLQDSIGSLEVGKRADIAALDMGALNALPMFQPHSQLVYSTISSQVSHVWCNGVNLLFESELQTLDRTLLENIAMRWQQKIIAA